MSNKFFDGLQSLFNTLANRRSATSSNIVVSNRISHSTLNEIYKTGLGNKIIRIKAGYSLKKNSIQFCNEKDKEFYNSKLHSKIKKALKWSLVFGRGVIIIDDGSGDLSQPLVKVENKNNVKLTVFSGKKVSVTNYSTNLLDKRYQKPIMYNVNGFNFHYTRVIDFTYVEPEEDDLPSYNHGGISEFELIYNQIVNDGVVERASASIVEKNSSFFYKIKGFKNALRSNQDDEIVKFYSLLEDRRSMYGAGLIDSEDEAFSVSQSLTNLKDADDISIRRIALVTGIPVPMLVGEAVSGLNSSGKQERTTFNEMLENMQEDYIVSPINELMVKLGMDLIAFKENQNVTPIEQVEYESKALDNAKKMYDIGYNPDKYLKEKGINTEASDLLESEFDEFYEDINVNEDDIIKQQ